LYSRAGLSKSDLFNPVNQDKLAITLMEEQGLEAFMRGELTVNQFGNRLANVWASLPVLTGDNAGQSRYEGDGLNTTLTSTDSFRAVLTRIQQTPASQARPAGPGGNGGV
jgi:muramidase (phage lysozyme)